MKILKPGPPFEKHLFDPSPVFALGPKGGTTLRLGEGEKQVLALNVKGALNGNKFMLAVTPSLKVFGAIEVPLAGAEKLAGQVFGENQALAEAVKNPKIPQAQKDQANQRQEIVTRQVSQLEAAKEDVAKLASASLGYRVFYQVADKQVDLVRTEGGAAAPPEAKEKK